MKKFILGAILVIATTGCGTIMESSRKTVNVTSNVKTKVTYQGQTVGNGKFATFNAINRHTGDRVMVIENMATGETRAVELEYSMNNWIWANWFLYGIGFPIDLITGAWQKVERANYYVEFED